MSRHCEKCDKAGYHPEIAAVRLIGGYNAELCMPCTNTFHEYIYPQMAELGKLTSRHDAAVMDGNCDRAAELAKQVHAERFRLYAISKAWVTRK